LVRTGRSHISEAEIDIPHDGGVFFVVKRGYKSGLGKNESGTVVDGKVVVAGETDTASQGS
jgi:hypothetical protein